MANTLTFANLTLTDANIFGGISFMADMNTGEEFSIGNTASTSVEFVTDVQLPTYKTDSTNGVFVWAQDSVSRGRYYITEVTKHQGMYTVTAYDAMIRLDAGIDVLQISYPATVSALASAIAAYIGCTVSGTIYNGTLSVSELDEDMSIRDLLGYIAEASGASVKVDGSDQLVFCYYADSHVTVTASEYKEIEAADYACAVIDKVTIFAASGLVKAEYGTGDNTLFIKGGNPFMENADNTTAQNILSAVGGITYTPLTCELFDETGLEVGTLATFGSTATLIMHLESSETGAVASSVGSATRAEFNKTLEDIVEQTSYIALDAQQKADDTKQNLWFTATDTGSGAGVHITEVPRADFEDPTSADYHSGGNLLASSDGIIIREGVDGYNLKASASGFAFRNGNADMMSVLAGSDSLPTIRTSGNPDWLVVDTDRIIFTGEVAAGMLRSPIGTIKETHRTTDYTLPNNDPKALCSLSLGQGLWLVNCGVRFAANASGFRRANLSDTADANDVQIQMAPSPSGTTQLTFTRIVSVSSLLGETFYLNGMQNSGSSLSVSGINNPQVGTYIYAVCLM